MEGSGLLPRLATPGSGTANNGSSSTSPAPGHAVGRDSRTIRRENEQFSLVAKMKRVNSILIRGHGTASCGHALPPKGHPRGYSLRWDTTPYETASYCSEA